MIMIQMIRAPGAVTRHCVGACDLQGRVGDAISPHEEKCPCSFNLMSPEPTKRKNCSRSSESSIR